MTKKVLIPIADGSEEMEAVIIIDILRRAGAEVTVASIMTGPRADKLLISASRGVKLQADKLIAECVDTDWAMIALPGGMPGAENLHAAEILIDLLQKQFNSGAWVAAICASPAVVLGRRNMLKDFIATCYPSFQSELASQTKAVSKEKVTVDGKLITSQGPGTAIEFALKLVEGLYDAAKAKQVAQGLVFNAQ